VKQFGFEEANRLDWSNEYLDFIIASKLLIVVFEERGESLSFRNQRFELRKEFQNKAGDIKTLTEMFRKAFPFGSFGSSREQSDNSMKSVLNMIVPASITAAQLTLSLGWAKSIINDPQISDFYNSYADFLQRYQFYVSQGLGGTWNSPNTLSSHKKFHNPQKYRLAFLESHNVSKSYNVLLDSRVGKCFEYLRDLVHLFYDSGLKTWWAPFIQFQTDLVTWSEDIGINSTPPPTLDGVLGPVFRRLFFTTSNESDGTNKFEISVNNYHEYLLLSMTRQNMRLKMGSDYEPKAHEKMETWGYKHGNKWNRADFNMLFDRLYLKNRIEDIATKYDTNDSSVQRRTARLADILDLPLTKAAHKEHRHN
jgi:hypothetical protein